MKVVTEDGVTLEAGDRAYDYYSMKAGHIGPESSFCMAPDLWFDFLHDDGTHNVLNGQRICSIEYARRRGFKGA